MARCIFQILSFIAVALFGSQLMAYPTPVDFSGKLLRWDIDENSPPVNFRIVTDNPADIDFYRTLVDDAATLWSRVGTSYLQLEQVAAEDHAHITVSIKGKISGGRFSSGFAIFDERDDHGPLHCRIEIADGGSTLGLAKTILHELGHCVGLGHSLIPESIMSYQLDQNRYRLDTDDRAAITRLYPADGSEPRLPPGCAISDTHTASVSTNWLLVFLLLSPLFLAVVDGRLNRLLR